MFQKLLLFFFQAVQQGSKPPDPVFMVISKEAVPQKATLLTAGGAAVTLAGTAFTAFAYGIGNFALRPEFYQKVRMAVMGGGVGLLLLSLLFFYYPFFRFTLPSFLVFFFLCVFALTFQINDGDTSVAAMAIPIMLGVLALQVSGIQAF